jgi:hypothetical protein
MAGPTKILVIVITEEVVDVRLLILGLLEVTAEISDTTLNTRTCKHKRFSLSFNVRRSVP